MFCAHNATIVAQAQDASTRQWNTVANYSGPVLEFQ